MCINKLWINSLYTPKEQKFKWVFTKKVYSHITNNYNQSMRSHFSFSLKKANFIQNQQRLQSQILPQEANEWGHVANNKWAKG